MRHLSILVLSWKLAEDFGMVMDMTMLMYLVMAEQICSAAAAVGYCCCCRLFLLLQSNYGILLLLIHTLIRSVFKTYRRCTNSIYNNLQQIYTGGAGKGGGFQSNWNAQVNVNQPFKISSSKLVGFVCNMNQSAWTKLFNAVNIISLY